jgi:hypothetical protein
MKLLPHVCAVMKAVNTLSGQTPGEDSATRDHRLNALLSLCFGLVGQDGRKVFLGGVVSRLNFQGVLKA